MTTGRGELLHEVMLSTGTTQSELSRLSGVHQPSISQFISGRADLSDAQLDRLLGCMGRRLEVTRRAVAPTLTRSERRSWQLHRGIARSMDHERLRTWAPQVRRNIERLRSTVSGQPHERNLEHWESLLDREDLPGIKRAMTGLDRQAIEMREVSPMGGLISDDQRRDLLAGTVVGSAG